MDTVESLQCATRLVDAYFRGADVEQILMPVFKFPRTPAANVAGATEKPLDPESERVARRVAFHLSDVIGVIQGLAAIATLLGTEAALAEARLANQTAGHALLEVVALDVLDRRAALLERVADRLETVAIEKEEAARTGGSE